MQARNRILDYYTRNPLSEFYEGKQFFDEETFVIDSLEVEELMGSGMLDMIDRFYCLECDEEVYPNNEECYCDYCEKYINEEEIEKRSTYLFKQSVLRQVMFDNKKLNKSLNNPDIAGGFLTLIEIGQEVAQEELRIFIELFAENIEDLHVVFENDVIAIGYGEQIIVIKNVEHQIEVRGKESYLYNLVIRDLAYMFNSESSIRRLMTRYLPGYISINLESEIYEYIPNLDNLVDRERLGLRENLHIAIYMLKCNIDLPDKTFLVFNALRGLESIIKLIAAKYSISYDNTLSMFKIKDDLVTLTPECKECLGDTKKQGVYRRLYQIYWKERNTYFHWDTLLKSNYKDTTSKVKDEETAKRIITKILDLINEACEIM